MKTKKIALLLSIFGISIGTSTAEEWLDVTRLVTNPDFADNTMDGWNWSGYVRNLNTEYNCQEFWYGYFDFYQRLYDLPNGKYRVGVQGFYRNGPYSTSEYYNYIDGRDNLTAYLVANSSSTLLKSIYSGISNYGCSGSVSMGNGYIPDNMYSARYFFDRGLYKNSLEVTVTDGSLFLGIQNNVSVNSNWCIFSNFTLEYYGTAKKLTSLSFAQNSINAGKGEGYTLTPILNPDNDITVKYNLTWSSSNTNVAVVDQTGYVRTLRDGSAVITCKDTESGLSASVSFTVATSSMTAQSVIINEIQSANIDQFLDPSFNYGGWVELYNPGNLAVALNNAYVKDAKGHSFRLPSNFGSIPAKGYRNLWFDHNSRYGLATKQVPFKLSKEGGTIIICDDKGVEVARQDYPATVSRTSYARTTDGGSTWAMTGEASPEASNNASTWGTEQLPEPVVSRDGGFFSGSSISFNVEVPAGCMLTYTTDGSTPTATSTSYRNVSSITVTRTFTCSNTSNYRFRLFQAGKLPSEVVTRSFIYMNTNYSAPVVSVTANNNDLFSAEYGVYVKGSGNGRPGNGQATACNWNMEWERAVNFEYFEPESNGNYSSAVFNQLVDFEMCGGWSRAWTPHSFKLKANKVYGAGNLDYAFFDSKPYIRNKSLQLRNGGNDTGSRLKDAALQEIVRRSGIYVDGQAWQPVHVFINGVYRSMLNMRETNNKHNAFANYGIDTDFIDQFEMSPDSGYVQKSGTKDAFSLWYEKSLTCGSSEADYQFICDSLVDIEEYVNYMAVEFYLGGTDWPQNNVKGFRAVQDDENGHPVGKFHFVLFDLDGTFATTTPLSTFASKRIYTFDNLYGIDENGYDITNQRYTEEIEFVTIFLNMLQNESFKKRFVDAFSLVSGSVFAPDRCQAIIQEMQAVTNKALTVEYGNCNSTANTLISQLNTSRQTTLINHLRNYLSLSGGRSVGLSSNVDGARLLVNNQEVPTGKFAGTLFGDVQIQAMAPAGYRFVGWSGTDASTNSIDVFSKGTTWNYYDQGSLDGKTWYSDMSSYSSGNAPLGYGKTVSTKLSDYKSCYYFGKKVNLSANQIQKDLVLTYTVDDGFVVYVNGKEAGRYNMPSGSVSYSSYASTYANDNPDSGTMTLNHSLFKVGSNTICVEVHNNSASSSDIYWDASLAYQTASTASYLSTDSIYTLGTSTVNLVASFEPVAESVAALAYPIKVNEVSPANDIFVNEFFKKNDWIELYNNSNVELDVAGLYVSDNELKPTKYQIVGNFANDTRIPAGGRLVIWADKVEPVSQLHTGFKLGNDNNALVLISSSPQFEANNASYFAAHPEMKGFVDALVYDACEYNQTVGRYPDGGKAIYRMQRPSIDKENTHSIEDQFLGFDKGLKLDPSVDPSGIDEMVFESEEATFQDWERHGGLHYDLQGRRVTRPQAGQLILRGKSSK